MSRCFPFPPPGYEHQPAADCAESLTKEKHKSKKDKKQKKENEKKEGKEKKHRDKSKERHGDKKDRKDRDRENKEKKKDKDRNRDRGGSSNQKLLGEHFTTTGEGKNGTGNISDSILQEELQSRIRDEKGAGRNQMVENVLGKVQGRNDGMLLEKTKQMDREMAQSPVDRQKRTEGFGVNIMPVQKTTGNHNISGSVTAGSIVSQHRNQCRSSSFITEKEAITEQKKSIKSSSLYSEKNTISEQKNLFRASGFLSAKDISAEQRNNIRPHGLLDKNVASEQRNCFGPSDFLPEKDVTMEQKNPFGPSGFLLEKCVSANKRKHIGSSSFRHEKDGITEKRNQFRPSVSPLERVGITEERNCIAPSLFPEKDAFSEERNRSRTLGDLLEKDTTSEQRNRLGPSGSLLDNDVNRSSSSRSIPEKDVISEQRSSGSISDRDPRVEQRDKISTSVFIIEKDANVKLGVKEKLGVQAVSLQKIEKHRNKEKKSKDKDEKERHKDREKRKEKDRTIEKGEKKDKVRKRTPETIGKEEQQCVGPVLSSKEEGKNANVVGSIKRKEINGFLHENELRPFKLQRTTPSPHPQLPPQVQNGRNLEYNNLHVPDRLEKPVDAVEPSLPIKPEAVKDRKVSVPEIKEHKANGSVQHQATKLTSSKSMAADSTSEINNEVLKKPPHPDSKYLDQILSVPKMAEWSEFDKKKWLFGHGNTQQKRITKVGSDNAPLVWAKTLEIEGADLVALPYVIPY